MKKGVFLCLICLALFACAKKQPTPKKITYTPKKTETISVKTPEIKTQKLAPKTTTPEFTEEALSIGEKQTKAEKEIAIYGRSTPPLKAIFFDFDSYEIRDDMKPILRENAHYILDHPGIRIELQGNCDERGSNEYNLALGEKRALMVKRYLINFGIDPRRLTTVSFGEERPLAQGHNESAWAINRRVDLVIK